MSKDNHKRDDNNRLIYPDLILHERGNTNRNLLAIEFKKKGARSNSISHDIEKLEYLTSNNDYRYKLGISIILGKDIHQTTIQYIETGKVREKETLDKLIEQNYHGN